MELGLGSTLLPGDPRLTDHIVAEVKSQGIFDQFRKECIADVDTKPAYQNLNARVESSVKTFLSRQTWRADLNKNQVRESLRKHIHDAPYHEIGVDRIVDQVVNPKIYSVFSPKVEDVVYKYLGIERPKSQRNGACDLKDLLPTDLDPVSPESVGASIKDESMDIEDEDEKKVVNGDEEKPSVSNIESTSTPIEQTESVSPIKKESSEIEQDKETPAMDASPVKAVLNASSKSDEAVKTEEEEEESPDFEPIDMNLNESNMSNDSHLSGISELTSHRSGSPDFATEFGRDNFDCSNQDSQLSKVSSNSRLSIVTDIGSSNHGSTPKSDAKEDSKSSKDNFKADSSKESKFPFEESKIKDVSKTSCSSKESSRDATDYKDNKSKDESKGKSLKVKHESRSSRGKERDSSRRHSSKRRHRSRSRDKAESDSQESKDYYQKPKEIKIDKKDDTSDEITDLKDRYKEKIRELREKIELTEKGKLGKVNPDIPVDKKGSVSIKEEPKKISHKSSSRSSSHHSKSSRSSETKESRDKSSSRHDERRHSNGKGESKSSSKSRRDSKSDSRSSDRSKDKKRRDEKKSKPTDDHSSLRKNLNDRRSSDRDGSDGSSSKYSHKTSYSTSSSKFGPTSELSKDSKEQHSSGETESVHDSLQVMFKGNDGLPKKVDPGSSEISLPLKKRRLLSEESQSEIPEKRKKSNERKAAKRKLEHLDSFKSDSDVASVPDDERVQIVEYADEEYDAPYPDKELILSLEETKKIILDVEPVPPPQPNLSEMELSIRQSLSEMMADHKVSESDDVEPVKVCTVMDSSSLLEALTDDSSTDKDAIAALSVEDVILGSKTDVEKSEEKIEECLEKSEQIKDIEMELENVKSEENKEISECNEEKETEEKDDFSIENQLEQFESSNDDKEKCVIEETETKVSEDQENTQEAIPEIKKSNEIVKEQNAEVSEVQENREKDVPEIENPVVNEKEVSADLSDADANENVEKCIPEIEKSEVAEKESKLEVPVDSEITENIAPETEKSDEKEQSVETTETNLESTDKVDIEPDTKNTNEIERENENQADSDGCNEDDTLVIDEDPDEKEKEDAEVPKAPENTCESEKSEESIEKETNEKSHTNDVEITNVAAKDDITADITEDKLNDQPAEEINKEDVRKLSESETNESAKDEIKEQSIDELATLDKNDSEADKDNIKESTPEECANKNEAPIDTIKSDDSPKISVDTTKIATDESDIDMFSNKDDEDHEEKFEEFDPMDDNSVDGEKSEEINVYGTPQDSLDVEKTEDAEESKDTNADPKEKIHALHTPEPMEKAHCSKDNRGDSPVDEYCYYFDSGNEKYLSFKKYLDQLEADTNKATEEKVETTVVHEVCPVIEPIEEPAAVSASLKRKHSPSPIVENIIKDNNNDKALTETNEAVVTAAVNPEIPVEEPVVAVKKRKVGRMKKSNSSGSVTSSSSQPDQPQDKEQQPQAAMVNGENFMMPLSPESDISVSSDKNLGGNLKDEKRGQRSNQRYSSDDLYKPRPLFTSSSRRTRRYHQA